MSSTARPSRAQLRANGRARQAVLRPSGVFGGRPPVPRSGPRAKGDGDQLADQAGLWEGTRSRALRQVVRCSRARSRQSLEYAIRTCSINTSPCAIWAS